MTLHLTVFFFPISGLDSAERSMRLLILIRLYMCLSVWRTEPRVFISGVKYRVFKAINMQSLTRIFRRKSSEHIPEVFKIIKERKFTLPLIPLALQSHQSTGKECCRQLRGLRWTIKKK